MLFGYLAGLTSMELRDPSSLDIEGRVSWTADGGVERIVDLVGQWRGAGATHVTINTMNAGFTSVREHLDALAAAAEALDLPAAPGASEYVG